MSHLVNKLVYEIKGVPQAEVTPVQSRLSLFTNKELIPALEKIFDKLIPGEETICIDKLEINLKGFSLQNDFEKQILDQISSYLSRENSYELINTYPEFAELFSTKSKVQNELSSEKILSINEETLEMLTGFNYRNELNIPASEREKNKKYNSLMHFLKSGSLSWNSEAINRKNLLAYLKEIFKSSEQRKSFLENQLVFNPAYILRIINTIGIQEYNRFFLRENSKEISQLTSMLIKTSISNNKIHSKTIHWNELEKTVFKSILQVLLPKFKSSLRELIIQLSYILGTGQPQINNQQLSNDLKILFQVRKAISSSIDSPGIPGLSIDDSAPNKIIDASSVYDDKKLPQEETDFSNFMKKIQEEYKTPPEAETQEVKDPGIEESKLKNREAEIIEDKLEESTTYENDEIDKHKTEEQNEIKEDRTGARESSDINSFLKEIKKGYSKPEHEEELTNSKLAIKLKKLKENLSGFFKENKIEEVDRIFISEKTNEEKSYFVENAGLVILAPFFSHLFKELDLIHESKFRDDLCQTKALLLTAYICYGESEFLEHQLILNKILCAYQPDEPVNLNLSLTDYDKEMADDLILSAIKYWSTLKNTGIDAFRSTFMKRKGIISKAAEGNWLIRIERTAFDVLLDSLPWPVSVHKYSWMNKLLTVEW